MEIDTHRTPIQNFYAGQSIFITGGTGFLGKILIEKLLRSCPDISMIYLLIRSKKGKSPEDRLDEIFDNLLYDRVKKEVPDFRKKVTLFTGDIKAENLGLSENDKNIIINKVSIIFHVAANVRFQEEIKSQIQTNVCSTDTILRMAKRMPNLKSFVYVSTIYAYFNVKHVEEQVYTYPINYKSLITFAQSDDVMEENIIKFASQWPNAYPFTKAIAENLLNDESGNFPMAIFRPAIITSTANEPLVGWKDNYFGEVGVIVSVVTGIQRFFLGDPYGTANFVPVDLTGNAIIASAWDVFNQFRKGKNILIYNFAPPPDAPTYAEWLYKVIDINKKLPSYKAQWLPSIIILQQTTLYRICAWIGELLPALLMDAVNICMNNRPRMWKLCRALHNRSYATGPFTTHRWNYSYDNIEAMWNRLNEQDQKLFNFHMQKFDWMNYYVEHYKGLRLFMLNEDDSNLKISLIRHKRLYWLHQTFKTIFFIAAIWIIWIIFTKIFT